MQKFVRYGRIPENERSINYIKLTFEENEDFTWLLSDGMDRLPALYEACKRRINRGRITIDDVLEPGISVFYADENGQPIIENEKQRKTLECLQKEGKAPYLLTGDEVAKGQDGEPLIINAKEA